MRYFSNRLKVSTINFDHRVIKSWRRKWHHLSGYFKYPQAIRKIIYTTNAVEAVCSGQLIPDDDLDRFSAFAGDNPSLN